MIIAARVIAVRLRLRRRFRAASLRMAMGMVNGR
jgi:hypothetical protein